MAVPKKHHVLFVCDEDAKQRLTHTLLELNLANSGISFEISDVASVDMSLLLSDFTAIIMEVTEQAWAPPEDVFCYVRAAPGRALIALMMCDTLWTVPAGFCDGVLAPRGRRTSLDADMVNLFVNTAHRRSLQRAPNVTPPGLEAANDLCEFLLSDGNYQPQWPEEADFLNDYDSRAAEENPTPGMLDRRCESLLFNLYA